MSHLCHIYASQLAERQVLESLVVPGATPTFRYQ